MKRAIIPIAALGFAVTPASASEWHVASLSKDELVFIDKQSIQPQANNSYVFWRWTFFRTPQGRYDNVESLQWASCPDKRMQVRQSVAFRGTSFVAADTQPAAAAYVIPDSLGSDELLTICGLRAWKDRIAAPDSFSRDFWNAQTTAMLPLIAASPSNAQWHDVGLGEVGGDRSRMFLDKHSLTQEPDGSAIGWVWEIFEHPRLGSNNVKAVQRFDCKNKRRQILVSFGYEDDIVVSYRGSSDDPIDVVAGTAASRAFDAACHLVPMAGATDDPVLTARTWWELHSGS